MDSVSEVIDPRVEIVQTSAPGSAEHEQAWAGIVDSYRPYMWAVAVKHVPPLTYTDAEDVVQTSLIKAARGFTHFERRSQAEFTGWLATITSNTALDLSAQTKRRNRREELRDIHSTSEWQRIPGRQEVGDPEQHISEIIETAEVTALLDKLEPNQRQVISLSLQGFKDNEISTMLGVNRNTVRTRIHRAKKRLRSIIKKL